MANKKYHQGDVVWCYYPYEEVEGEKVRPALVFCVEGVDEYSCIMITGTNYTGRESGFWVEEGTENYYDMGLEKSSFIRVQRRITLSSREIHATMSPAGSCSEDFFDMIIEYCENNKL